MEILQLLGHMPDWKLLLAIRHNDLDILSTTFLIRLMEMPSWPDECLFASVLTVDLISYSITGKMSTEVLIGCFK